MERSSSLSVDSLAELLYARWSLVDLRDVGEAEAVREGGYEYAGGGVASEAEGEWSRLIWRDAKCGTAADGPALGVEGEMVGGCVALGLGGECVEECSEGSSSGRSARAELR